LRLGDRRLIGTGVGGQGDRDEAEQVTKNVRDGRHGGSEMTRERSVEFIRGRGLESTVGFLP
jgi:hypothetical protein